MADGVGRRLLEKLRFDKVDEGYTGKNVAERLTIEDQKFLTSHLEELKRAPFRIGRDMTGLKTQNSNMREKTSEKPARPFDNPIYGEQVWKSPEKYPHNIPLTSLLQNVKKKGSKERNDFIVNRMGSLTGQDRLINLVRSSITGLVKKRAEKSDELSRGPTKNEPPFTTLFDFPGRTLVSPFDNPRNDKLSVKEYEKNKKASTPTLFGLQSRHTYMDFVAMLKNNVEDQKQSALGFCMVGDCHRAVRDHMREIGWQEKLTTPEERGIVTRALQRPSTKEDKEAVIKLFHEQPIKFIWVNGYVNWRCIKPGVVVSRIPSTQSYFSKTSLSLSLKTQLPFIYEKGEIEARIPRTYEIRIDGDMKHFSKQFRVNACACLLKKYYLDMNKDQKSIISTDGTVPIDCIDFAVKRVVELIRYTEHADLDEWCFSVVNEEEWDVFLLRFYDIVHYNAKFQIKSNGIQVNKLLIVCQKLLDHLYKYFPEMRYEGTMNLWICKPANGSCGRGVKVFRKLADIHNNCKVNNNYVIQKYIEMPLLIYNTKFDIRQWFVITSVTPLIIWMYNECYLRFCSQEFSLKNLHESVHLCNNTIQWKYKNGVRNPKLPNDNMWDNHTFSEFLRKELKDDQWLNIQDQMRQAIIAACLATQEKMFHRPNSFHLYGADFMITPDCQVWLIEINCQPSMKYSTPVTTRMCKAVLEDTVKVGLERKLNPNAPVGKFREIYHQSQDPPQAILPFGSIIHSRKVKILPRKPYPFLSSGDTSNRMSRRKWISYEEMANYKRHSMLAVKIVVKTNDPLDPGDITPASAASSVVINESAASIEEESESEGELNESKVEAMETAKKGSQIKGTSMKKVSIGNQNQNNPGENALDSNLNEKSDNLTNEIQDAVRNTLSISKQGKQKNKNTEQKHQNPTHEKISVVMIPENDRKKNSQRGSNGLSNDKETTERVITKEELLEKPGHFSKNIVAITKKALSNNKYSNVKTINPRSMTITANPKKQMKRSTETDDELANGSTVAAGDTTGVINTLYSQKVQENESQEIKKELYFCEEGAADSDLELLNGNGNLNNYSSYEHFYTPEKKVTELVESDLSQNSSEINIMYDALETKGNELRPEFSGYTIIGESAADRKLENILNSPEYLNLIGKTNRCIDPVIKAILGRQREYCQ